jgi:hypothetical protein
MMVKLRVMGFGRVLYILGSFIPNIEFLILFGRGRPGPLENLSPMRENI